MKNIALIMAIAALMAGSPVNKKQINTKQTMALKHSLYKTASHGYLFGHQDDTNYGHTWSYQEGRSDTKDVCGDYPGLMGFDLGHIETGAENNLDGVPFDKIRKETIKQYERGGATTLSWHLNNPVTGKDAWDVSDTTVVKSILPGGNKHEIFVSWLRKVATFINSIRTSKGIKVPVIFRPWHENTGSWFWWGTKLCSPKDYKALWDMTEKILRQYGANNIIYAYSPGGGANESEYMARYPGDKMVDILGVDIYQTNNDNAAFIKDVKYSFDFMAPLAKKHHKILAFTETGFQTIPEDNWWTQVLMPAIEAYPISYVLVWRNAHDKPEHYYGPFKGQQSEGDFIKFYQNKRTLFARDAKLK